MHLAICQTCRFTFALPMPMDAANCPKPGCNGAAIVSDGSYGGVFQTLHQAFPMASTREQRREIRKLLREMAAAKITPEQAVEQSALSPELIDFLKFLNAQGLTAFGVVITLLAFLQAQAWREEDTRERELDRQVQRETNQLLSENFEHLHHDQQTLEARLRRVEEAQLVEEEEAPLPSPARSPRQRQAESASGPKPQSPAPQATRKKKKGKKRA